MDLLIEEPQQRLAQAARRLLADQLPLERVRNIEDQQEGYPEDLWRQIGQLGWIALDRPEAAGGSGGGFLDTVALHRELGRSLAPLPHLEVSVCLHALTEGRYGDTGVLLRLIHGEAVAVLAHIETNNSGDPGGVELRAQISERGDQFLLSGTKLLVPFAAQARHLLVSARTDPNQPMPTLFLVDSRSAGIEIQRLPNIAGADLAAVIFTDVAVGPDAMVGAEFAGANLLEAALSRAAVLRCAQIAGAGERLLELSVGYASQRRQFGQPIGQFQAVQYLCTDIAIAAHLTDLFARQAAWRIDQGLHHGREVSLAKSYASRAAQRIAHSAHEVHAGLAFMLECDVQLFSRRLKHWELDAGDSATHDDAVVEALRRSGAFPS